MVAARAVREKRVNIQNSCGLSVGILNQDIQKNNEPAECSRGLVRSERFQRLFPYLEIKQDEGYQVKL